MPTPYWWNDPDWSAKAKPVRPSCEWRIKQTTGEDTPKPVAITAQDRAWLKSICIRWD